MLPAHKRLLISVADALGWLNWADDSVVSAALRSFVTEDQHTSLKSLDRGSTDFQDHESAPGFMADRNVSQQRSGIGESPFGSGGPPSCYQEPSPGPLEYQRGTDSVSVTIVTNNSARFIKCCLDSIFAQHYAPKEVIVVDNRSTDGTTDILGQFESSCRVVYNSENIGFAAAQNQAIGMARGDWILTLHPDVLLLPDFIERLVEAGHFDPSIGTICGKLLTMRPRFELPAEPVVDSTGIYLNSMLRRMERGSQEVDCGHYLQYEYVFGATATAALYRRAMIEDVSINNEFFDSDFFVGQEDADVAWRAQLMGWNCLYVPYARGYHVRTVLPGNRWALPPVINMHAVKNRFLMRIKNCSVGTYSRLLFSINAGDLRVVLRCLLWEQTSLVAFWRLAMNLKRAIEKRREIQSRRRVGDEYIVNWFRYAPVAKQVSVTTSRQLSRAHSKIR